MHVTRTRLAGKRSSREATPPGYVVLGGEQLGAAIADGLREAGHRTTFVDETQESTDLPGVTGDPSELDTLREVGIEETTRVVVATPDDGRNMLIAGLVRAHFGVPEALVLVNSPEREELVAGAGHEPLCATTVLSTHVVGRVEATTDRRHTA